MKDRFDVQLGVARPVEPGNGAPRDSDDEAGLEANEPVVVVEHQSRGLPFYLVPPLLIVLAALGVMAFQSQTDLAALRQTARPTPEPPARPTPRHSAEALATAVDAPPKTLPALTDAVGVPPAPIPARPPTTPSAPALIEVVETSAAKPIPAPAVATPKPVTGPASLFEHETVEGLKPVVAGAEPPLVSPAPER